MLVWVKKLHPAFLKFGKNIAKVLLIGLLMPDQITVSVSAFRTGSLSLIFYKLLFRVYLFFLLICFFMSLHRTCSRFSYCLSTFASISFVSLLGCFLIEPIPDSFNMFSFFSNTNVTEKPVDFIGIWTHIVHVEGKHDGH